MFDCLEPLTSPNLGIFEQMNIIVHLIWHIQPVKYGFITDIVYSWSYKKHKAMWSTIPDKVDVT